ncbi:Ig-like domain-containing domain [Emticicia sp. 21SJ11W-3]|uniref:Ig-like domain-containing domain n=1 Tax=Emticicia sp. 21SJ11W-3 TaxID=2916755 RepID=UPI00209DAF6F|nr:Ig-like domain-containing domain [Emticicia sp. 21SJ11W-3]UTA68203.1 Ig-like domain-containing protein [Emticicia sp. 21SJ11W-3]
MLNRKLYQLIAIIISSNFILGCAQFVPPTGGKKDETPPKLIKSLPSDKQTNFKGNQIELYFDELIDVTSLRQELVIVPEQEGYYNIKPKSNSVVLKFDKPFKDSTTYTLNFKKGIKDLNERNEARNLKIAFSTGAKIDSLEVQGNVKNLFTNQPILDAQVSLYQVQDSLNLRKTKPNYFTKTDSSGNFKFENLKKGRYRLYAFNDKNSNLRYDTKSEMIAFVKDTIRLDSNIANINMALYMANNEKPKNQKTLQRAEDFTIIYDKGIKSYKVSFVNPADSLPYSAKRNELKFYNIPLKTDTVKVNITVRDSADNELTHLQKIKFRDQERKRNVKAENLSFEIEPKTKTPVEKNLTYKLYFDTPIAKTDLGKIKIMSDTIKNEPLDVKELSWNSYKTQLIINKEITATREVKTVFETGAFITIKGDSSKKTINQNPILMPEDYGIVEGSITGNEYNKIVQLIDENYKVEKEQKTKEKFNFVNVKPGAYLIRIIEDKNNNGQWDYGNVEKDIEPEKVYFSTDVIRVKANFELRDIKVAIENK